MRYHRDLTNGIRTGFLGLGSARTQPCGGMWGSASFPNIPRHHNKHDSRHSLECNI